MPTRPPRLCPGCGARTSTELCGDCGRRRRQAEDARRGSSSDRLYDWAWRKAAKAFLLEHPLCAICERLGRVTAATLVDHIVPHRGDRVKFWDRSNWQSACASCHSTKTAQEDGGFGNPRKSET